MLIRFFTRRETNPQPNLIMNFLGTVADMLHHKNAALFKSTAESPRIAWSNQLARRGGSGGELFLLRAQQ
jgi:hypothetical protein